MDILVGRDDLTSLAEAARKLKVYPATVSFILEAILKRPRIRAGVHAFVTADDLAAVDAYVSEVDPKGKFRVWGSRKKRGERTRKAPAPVQS